MTPYERGWSMAEAGGLLNLDNPHGFSFDEDSDYAKWRNGFMDWMASRRKN